MEASNVRWFFFIFFFLSIVLLSRQVLSRSSLSFEVSDIIVHLAKNHKVEKYWKIYWILQNQPTFWWLLEKKNHFTSAPADIIHRSVRPYT